MAFGRNIQNSLEYSLHASVLVQVCFFLSTFCLSKWTLKITQILKITRHMATWRRSVKKAKFWSKVCINVKVTTLGIL